MICSDFTALTDRYLKEELPEEKREAFEAHFFECDGCFTELKLRERLYSKEIPVVTGDTRGAWAQVWSRLPDILPSFNLKPALVLASVLLVVVSSLLVVNNYKSAEFLYEISAFEPPAYAPPTETRGPGETDAFDHAMALYEKKAYNDALEQLNKAADGPVNPRVLFFKGIMHLQTEEPATALLQFNKIIETMDPSYYDEAIFYKGIALLRLNKKKAALQQFHNLADMFSPYAPKAKAIIQKIKR